MSAEGRGERNSSGGEARRVSGAGGPRIQDHIRLTERVGWHPTALLILHSAIKIDLRRWRHRSFRRWKIKCRSPHPPPAGPGRRAWGLYLPYALERKYPNAAKECAWQYVFPSADPLTGIVRRHHVDPSVVNKAIKVASRRVGLTKVISAYLPPQLRYVTAQTRDRHPHDSTIVGPQRRGEDDDYTHVLQQGGQGVPSPLDDLRA